jgi:hypothetical protein
VEICEGVRDETLVIWYTSEDMISSMTWSYNIQSNTQTSNETIHPLFSICKQVNHPIPP